ncbi:MAG: N-acetylneuraminate synthase [Syntrophales bacterium]|jgi:N,N'-diacetyllegionaminate synthase|nr:N-acetylneuraminate synthase [Syntrophales bacterium]MDY0043766.1 N-acetylneuraminate synthase [Syntrophales bacterium]
MKHALIIAEAGVNHNGSIETAKKLIDIAAHAGADAVKFQTFIAEKVVSFYAQKAEYQKRATGVSGSQLDMIRKLELGEAAHEELIAYSISRGIRFLSTPFDLDSIDLLNKLGLEIFKIPSGEITNLPYLRKIGMLRKQILLSTGMADLGEIEDALNILVESGTVINNITVLHCNTEYPAPFKYANLRAIKTIEAAFPGIQVGYSDHTPGIEAAIAAVALGAQVIEKHFTLDKHMEGPDHPASLEPYELQAMIQAIRNIEYALGDGIKKPSPSELKNKEAARKSIVASRNILKGEFFTEENLTVKRPGNGVSPMRWDEVIGRKSDREYHADELVEL